MTFVAFAVTSLNDQEHAYETSVENSNGTKGVLFGFRQPDRRPRRQTNAALCSVIKMVMTLFSH